MCVPVAYFFKSIYLPACNQGYVNCCHSKCFLSFYQAYLPDWPFFFFFSLSFYGAAPGAMANHLISNALLRPHGTNNPYNTLLGEPAVCNNPSISMYNAQGVLEFILSFSSESPTLCSFYGHIQFSFLLPFLCFGSSHTDSFYILSFLVLFIFHFPKVSIVRGRCLLDKQMPDSSVYVCFPVLLWNVLWFVIPSLLFIYFYIKYLCPYCE